MKKKIEEEMLYLYELDGKELLGAFLQAQKRFDEAAEL
ncbi:hypothetical protein BVRB_2g039410 [Beta vulgaris subsp. vulgaris]|nr:hypothetical protein BVRB_2g039410 [Beta vulgaris subsp. vulgaris]